MSRVNIGARYHATFGSACIPHVSAHIPSIVSWPCSIAEQLSRNHDILHLGRTFVDFGDLRVAQEALDEIFAHIPVATMYLYGLEGVFNCNS